MVERLILKVHQVALQANPDIRSLWKQDTERLFLTAAKVLPRVLSTLAATSARSLRLLSLSESPQSAQLPGHPHEPEVVPTPGMALLLYKVRDSLTAFPCWHLTAIFKLK